MKKFAVLCMLGFVMFLVNFACDSGSPTDATSTVAVTGVMLDSDTLHLIVGGLTGKLTATVLPSNATNNSVSWSTNYSGVATVSSNGVVTPIAAGTATITVTTTDGNKTDFCVVTVTTPAPPDPIIGSWAITKVEEKGNDATKSILNGVETIIHDAIDTTIDKTAMINGRVSNFKTNGWRVDTYIFNFKDSVQYAYNAIDSTVTISLKNGNTENAKLSIAGIVGTLTFSQVVDTISSSTDGTTGTKYCEVFTGIRVETMTKQ